MCAVSDVISKIQINLKAFLNPLWLPVTTQVLSTPTNTNSTNTVVWAHAKFSAFKKRQSDNKGLRSIAPDPRQTNTPSLSQWRIEEAGDVWKVSCWEINS